MQHSPYSVFDKMLEGVQVVTPGLVYIYVNNSAAEQGKQARENLLGRRMQDVYPGIEDTRLFRKLEYVMADGRTRRFVNRFDFADGATGWFELCMDKVEEGVLIRSFDITASRNLKDEVDELNVQLEEKVRQRTLALVESLEREKALNMTKSQFVSMASHEFRTPLSTILSSASLIEMYSGAEDGARRQKHVQRIKQSVGHLTAVLNDFLSLEKIDQEKRQSNPHRTNIAALAEEVRNDLIHLMDPGRSIITDTGEGPIICDVDAELLHNVLLNLVSNAIKYSHKDVLILTEFSPDELRISVSDSGIGIPENEQQHLFTRFFRCSNVGQIDGTGLGLTIVRHYVDLMKGKVTFSSKAGQGTTFIISLPLKTGSIGQSLTLSTGEGEQVSSL